MTEEDLRTIETYFSEGKFNEALYYFHKVDQKVPECESVQLQFVECLAKAGKTDTAREKLSKLSPSDQIHKYYLSGLIELYGGRSEQAKKFFEAGMRTDPDNKACRDALKKARQCEDIKEQGNVAIKEGRFDDAIALYTKAVEVDPCNTKLCAVLYANRALAHNKKKDTAKALADCDKAIELDEKYVKAYLRRAEIQRNQRNFTEAISDYTQAQSLDP